MLTSHQADELAKSTNGNLGLLTGGPGCGKTYSIAEWIKNSGTAIENIMCMAPTGKAATRMSEAFQKNNLPLEATTIHRALRPQMSSGGWSFHYGNGNRWQDTDLIVVDELSMVCTWLFGMFLGAVPIGAKVILVGDPNQLPPVGHGKPFKDLINSKVVPHGHLTEPHRFSGRIGQVCKAIQDGTDWAPSKKIDLDSDFPENYYHLESGNARRSGGLIIDLIDRLVSKYGMDPLNDIQVLVPLNAKSGMSRERVNAGLQQVLNPDGEKIEDVPFWVGDKVICLKNGLKLLATQSDPNVKEGKDVANGEIGIVQTISKVSVCVRFYNRFTVRFPRNDWKDQLALAYAITCHKSQGSGWPAVLTVIDNYAGAEYVCNRPWVYTALSRASKISLTVGPFSRMLKFLKDPGIDMRVTALKRDLVEWKRSSLNTRSVTL